MMSMLALLSTYSTFHAPVSLLYERIEAFLDAAVRNEHPRRRCVQQVIDVPIVRRDDTVRYNCRVACRVAVPPSLWPSVRYRILSIAYVDDVEHVAGTKGYEHMAISSDDSVPTIERVTRQGRQWQQRGEGSVRKPNLVDILLRYQHRDDVLSVNFTNALGPSPEGITAPSLQFSPKLVE